MAVGDTVLSGSYQVAVGKKRLTYLFSPEKIEFFTCFHSSNGEAGSLLTVHDSPHSAAFMILRGHLHAQALSARPG